MNDKNESRPMTDDEMHACVGGMAFAAAAQNSKILGNRASGNRQRVRERWLSGAAATTAFASASSVPATGGGTCGPNGCSS